MSYSCNVIPLNKCLNIGGTSQYTKCTSAGNQVGSYQMSFYPSPNCNTSVSQTYHQSVGTCMPQADGTSEMSLCSSSAVIPTKPLTFSAPSPAPPVPPSVPCPGNVSTCTSPLAIVSFGSIDCKGSSVSVQATNAWPDMCYVEMPATNSAYNTKYSCKDGTLRLGYYKGCHLPPIMEYVYDLVGGYSPCLNGRFYYCQY